MNSTFGYDWFHGASYEEQCQEARIRCAFNRFPDKRRESAEEDEELKSFLDELESKTLIYLRDGFSYEVKEFVQLGNHTFLSFECEPVDDQYKVGAFVVSVPFEEIVRVEVFAVHPSEKPSEGPQITGFRASHDRQEAKTP